MPYFTLTQFQIGSVILYSWGLMVGLAFVVGYFLTLWQAKKKGIDQNKIFILIILIFLGALAGARLSYLAQFGQIWDFFQAWPSGLTFYGGLIGALIVSWIWIKKTKMDFWKVADLFAPSLALGIFIGRIGCFLIKDHPGTETNLPWAIQWPDMISRHPVALYLSING